MRSHPSNRIAFEQTGVSFTQTNRCGTGTPKYLGQFMVWVGLLGITERYDGHLLSCITIVFY